MKNKKANVAYGKEVVRLRKEHKLTQTDLARYTEIPIKVIRSIERGEIAASEFDKEYIELAWEMAWRDAKVVKDESAKSPWTGRLVLPPGLALPATEKSVTRKTQDLDLSWAVYGKNITFVNNVNALDDQIAELTKALAWDHVTQLDQVSLIDNVRYAMEQVSVSLRKLHWPANDARA